MLLYMNCQLWKVVVESSNFLKILNEGEKKKQNETEWLIPHD